jgi:hypothetical protein
MSNSGNNYNGSPGRGANTENFEQSFPNSNRRNTFAPNVILGYEEVVSEEYLEFIVKLITYYTKDRSQTFLTRLEEEYTKFISKFDEKFIKHQCQQISDKYVQLLLKIFKSTTFKAIIFSFINFFSHRDFPSMMEALEYFFEQLLSIFRHEHWMNKLIYAQEGSIIHKISILMIINRYVILSWNSTSTNGKLDKDRIFAIFQETMFATSLEAILGKSANTFVCNLPGCGDCVTIFKNLKKVFLFTECKKQGSRAKNAIREFNNAQGMNKSTTDKSLQRDLIKKVDRDIQSRFFSSFLANYCQDEAKILLTFGILEIPNISRPPHQEDQFRKKCFNMVIPEDILPDLVNLLVFDVKNKKETFNLRKHLKSLKLESDKNCSGVARLPLFNFGNQNLTMSNNSVEKWITTQETAKFLTEYNISNNQNLTALRKNRRLQKKEPVLVINSDRDPLIDWPIGWVRVLNTDWNMEQILYRYLKTGESIREREATRAWSPWTGILRTRIDLDPLLDSNRKNKKLFKKLIEEYPNGWKEIKNKNIKRLGNVETCYLHVPSGILLSKQEFDLLKGQIKSNASAVVRPANSAEHIVASGTRAQANNAELAKLANNGSAARVKASNSGNSLNKISHLLQGLSLFSEGEKRKMHEEEREALMREKVGIVRNVTGKSQAANGARMQGSNAANENPRSRRLKKFYDSIKKLSLKDSRKEYYKNLRKEKILNQDIPPNRLEAFLNREPERFKDEEIKVVYQKYTDPEYNKKKAEENQYYNDVAMGRYEYGKNPITNPPQFKYNVNEHIVASGTRAQANNAELAKLAKLANNGGLSLLSPHNSKKNNRKAMGKALNVTGKSQAANGAIMQARTSKFENFTSPFKAQKSKELFSLDPERDPLNDWPIGWVPLSGFNNTGQKWFKHPASGMIASESRARLYKSNSKKHKWN